MGSGFALDSFNQMKQTLSLKKIYRVRYNEMKNAVSNTKAKYHKFIDKSNLSPQELEQYKQKVKRKIILDRRKTFLISIFCTATIAVSIYYISTFLFNYFTNQ